MCVFIRRSIAAVFALVVLAGCGTATAPSLPSTAPSASSSPASNQTPAATEASSGTRTITHAMGTTDVPTDPQRVVVLDTGELDSVLALGVTPVGAVTAFADGEFPAYLQDQAAGIQKVGTIAEPNLEAIVALNPDLIISNKTRHEDIYPQLSQIAPTVFAERVGVVWKDNFKLHAEALGKTAEAEQIQADYQARIEQLQQQLGQPDEISVSVVRFLEGQVRQYQRGSFIGTVLDDVGVARPEQQQNPDETWTEVNRELIPQLDADVMFVTSYGPADKTPLSQFRSDPLWSQLQVVQNNRVYEVADDHWMLGLGYLAADRVLDDLEQYLAANGSTPATTPETTAEAATTRTVTDALGNNVTIPANPQRVLALGEEGLLADLIDAGVKPVAATVNVTENIPGFAAGELDGIQLFASSGDTSLETLVALQPDLIVGSQYFIEEIGYDTLSQLAPTVAVGGTDPRESYVQTLAIFGKEAEAQQRIAQFEQQVQQAGQQLNANGRTVSLGTIYPGPNAAAWIDGPYAPPRLAKELGFTLRPGANDLGGAEVRGGRAFISLEQLGLFDGETIILLQSPDVQGESQALQAIKNGPIWQTLPAVQNNRVVELNRLEYFGFRGEQALLNKLIEVLKQ